MKNKLTITAALCIAALSCIEARCQTAQIQNEEKDDDTTEVVEPIKKVQPHKASIGVEIGYNSSYLLTNGEFNSPYIGWCAGMFAYIPIAGHLYFQPGLYYSVIGGSLSGITTTYSSSGYPSGAYSTTQTDRIHTVEVPLVIGFKYGRPRRKYQGNFAGIGANFAYCLNANYSTSSSKSSDVSTGSLPVGTNASDAIRPFMVGAALYIGAQWNHVVLRVRAQYALTNLAPEGSDNAQGNQIILQPFYYGVQFGYVFGKIRHAPRKHVSDPYLGAGDAR